MIVRFRTPEGTFRATVDAADPLAAALDQSNGAIPPHATLTFNGKTIEAAAIATSSIAELGLKHGDMLSVSYDRGIPAAPDAPAALSVPAASLAAAAAPAAVLPVDKLLAAQSGLIPRKRSPLCRHGDAGMCEYCLPLPPFDPTYQSEHGIKHTSFHAEIKRLTDGTNQSQLLYIPPLELSDFGVNLHCKNGHAPYPAGICSQCVPLAITLQQQKFRMVDHVEFASLTMVDKFINAWRTLGMQRIGLLYGTYEVYDKVPLGVKAVVRAIYEPPQSDANDGITLEEFNQAPVLAAATALGIYPVGVIFTDLLDAGGGKAVCRRHKDSYFLSLLEILLAAQLQNAHPNATPYSKSGTYSSKFVTVVVSGNSDQEIDMAAYQVSEGAEALVKADLVAGLTHPSMMWINEPSGTRYVPEVFYLRVNEYGLVVKENAKPAFPVEYLIVSLTHGFPEAEEQEPAFPIENRSHMGEVQSTLAVAQALRTVESGDVLPLGSLHLLAWISNAGVLGEEWGAVAGVLDGTIPADALTGSPGWATLKALVM